MKIRSLTSTFATCAVLHVVASAYAGPTTITFEEFARPGSAAFVTDQYAHLGVRFSTVPTVDSRGVERSTVDVIAYPFGAFGTRGAAMWGNPVTLTFATLISDFAVLMADTESGTFLGSVEAFDDQGRSVAYTQAYAGTYNTPWFFQQRLAIDAPGVRRIVLRTDADGAVFDNIAFTSITVPTPGSAGAIAAGMIISGRRRR